MLGLLREVAVHTPVVVFTNATTVLDDDLRAAGLTGEFAAVVSSARTRAAVPSAAAFTAAEEAVAVVAMHRCGPVVYISSDARHVRAARRRGWQGWRFTDATGLRHFLGLHGLLIYGCDPDDPDRPIEPWHSDHGHGPRP